MTATKAAPVVQFRPGPLAAELARRGTSPGLVASRDLSRYYDALARELDLVDLTAAQWGAIRSAVAARPDADLAASAELGMAVGDRLTVSPPDPDGAAPAVYRDGWDAAEVGALLAVLFAASPARALAILDAAERWGRG